MPDKLCIHGHFYQPPRENPWTEAVDPEPSAAPFHDWNERIYRECYRANDNARITRPDGVVEAIVSNYHYLSFNLGPTLMAWIQRHHPHGYQRLLDADKVSRALHQGHGNAIAQAYNHAILPLCNERDQRTQILWGLADFRRRFGREAESLWLPETAVNHEVLEELIAQGLAYCILAPGQCQRVRPLGGKEDSWHDCSDSGVDPGLAYKYLHRDGSGRSIALFFYDGPVAQAIAFENALRSSQELIALFKRAKGGAGRLIHVATDGESYGHHSAWGDRVLAYALRKEAVAQGFEVTNYGAYLAENPPLWEADIKAGPDGEGTAWSCAHGVGRWIRDCGCHTGGGPGWNQSWRGPLREALDHLRDGLSGPFEGEASRLLKDPWAARNAYVDLVLDPSLAAKDRFFEQHATRPLDKDERHRALALLDMQRQCLLMYTSCGWFFNDLSGIETQQILKYAARAMDYAKELGLADLRQGFLEILSRAKSNVAELGHGDALFLKDVEPLRVMPERLAAHLGIMALAEGAIQGNHGGWDYQLTSFERQRLGSLSLATGRLRLRSRLTEQEFDGAIAAVHFGGMDVVCQVKPFTGEEAFLAQAATLAEAFKRGLIPGILSALRDGFGGQEFGLDQVLPDGRSRFSKVAFQDLLRQVSEQTYRIYQDNKHRLDLFQAAGYPLPAPLRAAAEYTLSAQFEAEIQAQRESRDAKAYAKAIALAKEAGSLGYRLDTPRAKDIFGAMITDAVRLGLEGADSSKLAVAVDLLRLTRDLGIHPDLVRAQEFACRSRDNMHDPEALAELARLLWLDPALLVRPEVAPLS